MATTELFRWTYNLCADARWAFEFRARAPGGEWEPIEVEPTPEVECTLSASPVGEISVGDELVANTIDETTGLRSLDSNIVTVPEPAAALQLLSAAVVLAAFKWIRDRGKRCARACNCAAM